jgi:hypothetical protein
VQTRYVEQSAKPSKREDGNVLLTPGRAVLRLLQNSAERFEQILEASNDVGLAGRMTGLRIDPGLDTYA